MDLSINRTGSFVSTCSVSLDFKETIKFPLLPRSQYLRHAGSEVYAVFLWSTIQLRKDTTIKTIYIQTETSSGSLNPKCQMSKKCMFDTLFVC